MAEIVGAVASVLTLCQVVSEGASRVLELYRAPAEIKALQEQVQAFGDLVQALKAPPDLSVQNVLRCALLRAQNVIEELNQLIKVKLIRQVNGSSRLRRKAWLKHKTAVRTLRLSLKDARKALGEALSVSLLSDVTVIKQQSTKHYATILSIERKLESAEDLLERTALGQATIASTQHASATPQVCFMLDQSSLRMLRPRTVASTESDESSAHDACQAEQMIYPQHLPQPRISTPDCLSHQQLASTSRFELLPSFRPETYTPHSASPRLLSHGSHDLYVSQDTRVTQFGMLYSQKPRQWTRLTMRIITNVNSRFWDLEKARTYSLNVDKSVSYNIPRSLRSMIEDALQDYENVPQDSHINVFLSNGFDQDKSNPVPKLSVQLMKSASESKLHLQEVTRMAYHLNCPWYFDRSLTSQQPLYRNTATNVFIAFLEERWVLVSRFGTHKTQINSGVYIMQALHCVHGTPGVNRFVGVILDENTRIVSGFLSELPAQGRLSCIMSAADSSARPLSWARREKWCKQIVQAVSEVHRKGFVVGSLGNTPDFGVAIDADDNAILYGRFQTSFRYTKERVGVLPPEYRQTTIPGASVSATPDTDVYQLGWLLWRVAANDDGQRSRFCKTAGCPKAFDTSCDEPHADPVHLPSPGVGFPQYLTKVIATCRAEVGSRRAPAWKLLKLFPSGDDALARPPKCVSARLTQPEDCIRRFGHQTLCDRCRSETTHHYFHCNICAGADYDLCLRCFSEGAHCVDQSHYLREFHQHRDDEKYYTNVKGNGRREVIIP